MKEHSTSATAGKDGDWRVELPAMPPGGPFEIRVRGTNEIVIKDVLIGEVWFCSGQSNMQMTVRGCLNFGKESTEANYPALRMFTAHGQTSDRPQQDCPGEWVVCRTETVGGFSGTAYFFGRNLHQELKVPVGLINSSWGGTPCQAWTSAQSLQADPALRYFLKNWKTQLGNLPKDHPLDHKILRKTPGGLFNAMVLPFVSYRIRGVIWYQGEGNRSKWNGYEVVFTRMIRDWRTAWGQGEFPFLYVQLPRWLPPATQPVEDGTGLAFVRDSQLRTLK